MSQVSISNHFPLIVFWLSTKTLVSMFSSKHQVSLSLTNNLHNSKPTSLYIQFHIVSLILILCLMRISIPSLKFFLYWSWEISCSPSCLSDSLATHSLWWLLFSSKSLKSSDICLHKWYNSAALNIILILLCTKFRSLTSTVPLNFRLQCQNSFFFFFRCLQNRHLKFKMFKSALLITQSQPLSYTVIPISQNSSSVLLVTQIENLGSSSSPLVLSYAHPVSKSYQIFENMSWQSFPVILNSSK